MISADTVVVLDFETTGLSPDWGDCAIEIGAVRIKEGGIVERFQELMNPGFRISSFIENYTGITNEMLGDALPADVVMNDFADFIGDVLLVKAIVSAQTPTTCVYSRRICSDNLGVQGLQ